MTQELRSRRTFHVWIRIGRKLGDQRVDIVSQDRSSQWSFPGKTVFQLFSYLELFHDGLKHLSCPLCWADDEQHVVDMYKYNGPSLWHLTYAQGSAVDRWNFIASSIWWRSLFHARGLSSWSPYKYLLKRKVSVPLSFNDFFKTLYLSTKVEKALRPLSNTRMCRLVPEYTTSADNFHSAKRVAICSLPSELWSALWTWSTGRGLTKAARPMNAKAVTVVWRSDSGRPRTF